MLLLVVLSFLCFASAYENNSSRTSVYAIYFPQFHEDPLNNEIWGKGYSDWNNLKAAPLLNRDNRPVIRPHPDIGYYDLSTFEARKKQATIAKKYGVDGFIYYHYWFYHHTNLKVLSKPLENMLKDGEPNLPFAFSWAAHNWLCKWVGNGATIQPKDGKYYQKNVNNPELLYEQLCPIENDTAIAEHYQYLRQFFHHKNYIKVNGKPLFEFFRFTDTPQCLYIVPKLQELAIKDGFPGLHIIGGEYTMADHEILSPSWSTMEPNRQEDKTIYSGSFYFPVHIRNNEVNYQEPGKVPSKCLFNKEEIWKRNHRPHYIGVITAFDSTPRRSINNATLIVRKAPHLTSVQSFEIDILNSLFYDQCCFSPEVRDKGGKFITILAWNEWGEGMVLEPSEQDGYAYLHAVKKMKKKMEHIGCDAKRLEHFYKEMNHENK
eukprot:gene12339-13492_t